MNKLLKRNHRFGFRRGRRSRPRSYAGVWLTFGGLLPVCCAPACAQTAATPRALPASPPAIDSVTGIVHSQRLRSGVPLGGIGAGTFQWMTDGTVAQAAIADNWDTPLPASPGCFAALWTRADGRASARVLALNSAYGLPTVSKLDYDGLYPQANLTFPEASSPVQASLLAFSPLIPFDMKNSSYPAAAIIMRLKNPTSAPVEVSVALSWESLLPDSGGKTDAPHIPAAVIPSAQGFFGARFKTASGLAAQSELSGAEMTVMAYPQRAQAVVTTALWEAAGARPDWWEAFAREGSVSDGKPGDTALFARPAAVIAVRLMLKPGEATEIPFAVSWYLRSPQSPSAQSAAPGHPDKEPGRYYQAAFDNADDAAMQLLEDWRSLYGLTEEWQKRLTFSNMPRWLSRRMINSAAPLSANTIHTRDGRFAFLGTVGGLAADAGSPSIPAAKNDLFAPPIAAANTRSMTEAAEVKIETERETTWSHQCADALLLAFFPQLAAQELAQFAATQDAQGFVAPPADANWRGRLGPALASRGPLIPNGSSLFVSPASKSAGAKAAKPYPVKSAGAKNVPASGQPPQGKTPPAPFAPNVPELPPASPVLAPLDASAAYVLQSAQFSLWTGGGEDLKQAYPRTKRAVRALLSLRAAEGLPPTSRPASLTLWLAALRAGQKLARTAGDEAFAQECEAAAQQGGMALEARYWNGQFYQDAPIVAKSPRNETNGANKGNTHRASAPANADGKPADNANTPAPDAICAADQLWGQWSAHQLDLGPLLPPDHLLRAAQSVQQRNDRILTSSASAALSASLPDWQARVDGKPLNFMFGRSFLLSASILADGAVNIWQDQPEAGVALLHRLEAGRDNALPLSSLAVTADWNLLYALQGFALDMSSGRLTLAPNIPGTWREFNAPVFAPTFWGRMEYHPTAHGGVTTFRLDRLIGFVAAPKNAVLRNRAELTLKTLRVLGPPRHQDNSLPKEFTAHVSVGQKPIGGRSEQDAAGFVTVTFDSPLTLTAGDRLEVDVH